MSEFIVCGCAYAVIYTISLQYINQLSNFGRIGIWMVRIFPDRTYYFSQVNILTIQIPILHFSDTLVPQRLFFGDHFLKTIERIL